MITVLSQTEERNKKGCILWKCKCKCGKTILLSSEQIQHNKSCGCLKKMVQSKIGSTLHFIDGTCVEWVESRKHRSDNKSGFRGVTRKSNGKYFVKIGFQGRRDYLGTFDTLEEAVKARLSAEEALHIPFLAEYYGSISLIENDSCQEKPTDSELCKRG